ncbi:hypothetical protein [Haloferula sargassicola]|uniref:Uncharacterized protein n=1 Tax=Haloferula sargassicola TaxID=490096 RepID=A0ABP9UUY2_9BACT
MKAFKIGALVGLILTAIGPVLVFTGTLDVEKNKTIMLIGMLLWFLGATPWLGSNKLQPADKEVEI